MIEEFDVSKFNLQQYDKKPILLHGGSVSKETKSKKNTSKKLKIIHEDEAISDNVSEESSSYSINSRVVKLNNETVSEFGYYDDIVKYPPERTPKNCNRYELAGLISTVAIHLRRLKDIGEYVFVKEGVALNTLANPSAIAFDLLEAKVIDANIIRDVETVSYSLLEKYQPDLDLLRFNFDHDRVEKEKVITKLWGFDES